MRRVTILVGLALVLAACGDGGEAEQMSDAEALEAVEASQKVPAQELVLDPIGFGDIELAGALGFSCTFAARQKPDVVLALASREMGLVKTGGEMVRLAPDPGSGETVAGSWRNYDGQAISFTLALEEGGQPMAPEVTVYPAQLTIRDFNGDVAYESAGMAECGV